MKNDDKIGGVTTHVTMFQICMLELFLPPTSYFFLRKLDRTGYCVETESCYDNVVSNLAFIVGLFWLAQLNMGAEIPKSLYFSYNKPVPRDGMEVVTISMGSKKKFRFDIDIPNSILR